METEKKYEAPFIKDPQLFKAVSFMRKMIDGGDDDFFALCKAAKHYSIDRTELAYELLRFRDFQKNGDSWKKKGKADGEEADSRADFI